jgi:hypothetical protein
MFCQGRNIDSHSEQKGSLLADNLLSRFLVFASKDFAFIFIVRSLNWFFMIGVSCDLQGLQNESIFIVFFTHICISGKYYFPLFFHTNFFPLVAVLFKKIIQILQGVKDI